jgi:hypothetical protein
VPTLSRAESKRVSPCLLHTYNNPSVVDFIFNLCSLSSRQLHGGGGFRVEWATAVGIHAERGQERAQLVRLLRSLELFGAVVNQQLKCNEKANYTSAKKTNKTHILVEVDREKKEARRSDIFFLARGK